MPKDKTVNPTKTHSTKTCVFCQSAVKAETMDIENDTLYVTYECGTRAVTEVYVRTSWVRSNTCIVRVLEAMKAEKKARTKTETKTLTPHESLYIQEIE